MRPTRRARSAMPELGGTGEDSFVAVVVTKLTGALLFILLLTMVIMALIPRADSPRGSRTEASDRRPLEIATPERLPDAMVGRPYALALATIGARDAVEWTLSGELPAGLSWASDRGMIEGVPTRATEGPVGLEVAARDGFSVARRVVALTVLEAERGLAATAAGRRVPDLRGWLEQGFGFLVLLLVWLLGMGVVSSLERWSSGGMQRRVIAYRALLSLAAMVAAGVLWVWLQNPVG